jgi:hypothetical protein
MFHPTDLNPWWRRRSSRGKRKLDMRGRRREKW